jgi:hypothetical protein
MWGRLQAYLRLVSSVLGHYSYSLVTSQTFIAATQWFFTGSFR